jgi:hypothetical protein
MSRVPCDDPSMTKLKKGKRGKTVNVEQLEMPFIWEMEVESMIRMKKACVDCLTCLHQVKCRHRGAGPWDVN